jgi:hypothetical protein
MKLIYRKHKNKHLIIENVINFKYSKISNKEYKSFLKNKDACCAIYDSQFASISIFYYLFSSLVVQYSKIFGSDSKVAMIINSLNKFLPFQSQTSLPLSAVKV